MGNPNVRLAQWGRSTLAGTSLLVANLRMNNGTTNSPMRLTPQAKLSKDEPRNRKPTVTGSQKAKAIAPATITQSRCRRALNTPWVAHQ